MIEPTHNPAVKFIAEVRNSQEVTLIGDADFHFWCEKLSPEQLVPSEVNGRAELIITAVASRWMGVRFTELSFAVSVARKSGGTPRSVFLLTAYNTSRAFAFMERTMFQTPYVHGAVHVQCGSRPCFQLQRESSDVLQVGRRELNGIPRIAEVLDWTIYLPTRSNKAPPSRKRFYARLSGLTEIAPFVEAEDRLKITKSASAPVLGWLLESNFTGREWHIRNSATHARSKTYSAPTG